jgi:hypothetical protein
LSNIYVNVLHTAGRAEIGGRLWNTQIKGMGKEYERKEHR